MATGHLICCGLFISGSCLQELSQLRENILSDSYFCVYPIKKRLYLSLISLFGIALDLYSLLYLPLLTYILLGSTRIAFYKYFSTADYDLSIKNTEKIGFVLIAISCSIAIFFGGMQKVIQTISADSNFIIYNFVMTIFLFVLKLSGFFSKNFFLETCIPASIGVFSIGVMKITMLLLVGYIRDDWFDTIFQYAAIGLALIFINFALFKALYKQYDPFMVFGAYQIWYLGFGYIAGLVFIFYGASYYTIRVAYCVLSGIIGILGIGFLMYEREAFLKTGKVNKNPQQMVGGCDEMEMIRGKMGNSYDCDENNDLMNYEVIDEDS